MMKQIKANWQLLPLELSRFGSTFPAKMYTLTFSSVCDLLNLKLPKLQMDCVVRCLEVALPEIAALKFLSNWPIAAFAACFGAHMAFSQQSVKLLRNTPLIALVIGRSSDRF